MNNSSNKLAALTSAALALPGMVPNIASAQTAPEDFAFSYRASQYEEDPLAAELNVTGEEAARYTIDIHQIGAVIPLSGRLIVNANASTESMSGASPWYVVAGPDGEPIQVMSGASIEERRDDYGLSSDFYGDSFRLGAGVSRSTENDYESLSANLSTSIWFNQKNTTLDFGVSFSDDEITPTQQAGFFRILEDTKTSQSLSTGLTQVVSKSVVVAASFTYSEFDGFLSDPYKLVLVEGELRSDSRPRSKLQTSFDFKLRKYVTSLAAAWHLDYRYYDNDWGVSSHTITSGWYQNISTWQFSARVRYYDQTAANFFNNFFEVERPDGFHTADYRLSAYSATSFNLGITKYFDAFALRVNYEDYSTAEGFETDLPLSPGLVSYNLISAGFDFSF